MLAPTRYGLIQPMDERDSLKQSFLRNSQWANLSGWAIVAGLVFEVIVLLWFSKDRSWLETGALIIANLIIAAGVGLEIHFGHRVGAASMDLQRISDEKIAEAEARAAEANQKAQEASLELARFRAPRMLTREQMDRVSDQVKEFAPLIFDAAVNPGDPEFRGCLRFIELVLGKAGWTQIDWVGSGEIGNRKSIGLPNFGLGASVRNVVIGFFVDESSTYIRPATTLADALTAEGIIAHAAPMLPGQSKAPITIVVGPKT